MIVHAGAHPAVGGVHAPEVYGDSYVYGPLLQPTADLAAHGVIELGKVSAWWGSNRSGLVLREFGRGASGNGRAGPRGEGDCTVVFSMAAPVPASVLRSLALYAGCNAWSDLGDVVAADGGMLAVHSVRPGERVLRLPKAMTVTDAVTGRTVAQGVSSFKTILKSPDTRVFLLDE